MSTNASGVSRVLREAVPAHVFQATDIGGMVDVLCPAAYAANIGKQLDARGYRFSRSMYSAGVRFIVTGRD